MVVVVGYYTTPNCCYIAEFIITLLCKIPSIALTFCHRMLSPPPLCYYIVSTKIPFKGTSKEYVGEDVAEIFQSVKRALQGECTSGNTAIY